MKVARSFLCLAAIEIMPSITALGGLLTQPRRLLRMPLLLLALVGSCLVAAVGCDNAPEPQAAVEPPTPTPELRFKRFMDDFRRRVEGTTTGSQPIATGGSTSYTGDYTIVSSEITPPDSPEGVHRATIVIREKSSFTVINLPDEEEQLAPTNPADKPRADDPLLQPTTDDILLAEPTRDAGGNSLLESPIHTRGHSDEHVYELAYVDGFWRLKSDLDPETAVFLAQAFRLALGRQ